MSKVNRTIRNKKQVQQTSSSFDFDKIIPEKYQSLASVGVIILLFLIFFAPVFFEGKTFQSGDIVTGHSYETVKEQYNGGTLWNPYIFAGLPSQFSGVGYERWFDFINTTYAEARVIFGNIFNNDFASNIIFMMVLSISTFFLMRFKKASQLISLLTALAVGFSTGIVVFVFIGHITKLYALSVFPIIIMQMLKFQEKIKILDFVILTIALSFAFAGWHIQIIFYIFFALLIYFIFYFINFLKYKDKLLQLVKSGVLLVIAAALAILMSADMYGQLIDYTKYSTRGTKSVLEENGIPSNEAASQGSGHFYEYATNWSFSPGEVLTFINPSYYGFGTGTYNGPLTNNQDVEVNTYFGQMPFVDVAMYMGVIVFFLAIFGVIIGYKDKFIQLLGIICILSLWISFGKNFPPFLNLFNFMFEYFPYFDKFRVPSMILVLIQVLLPVIAGLGLMKFIKAKEENDHYILNISKYFTFGLTGLLVLVVLLSSPLKSNFIERLQSSPNSNLMQISEWMSEQFLTDMILAFVFSAGAFWMLFLYSKNRINREFMLIALILLSVSDLFRVSSRGAKYVPNQDIQTIFNTPDYVNAIRNEKNTQPFRILNLNQKQIGSVNNNSNYHMYFLLEDFAGYSGIKPRAYQDYMDVVTPGNPTLWRMANIKYIVVEKPINYPGFRQVMASDKNVLYENINALPRAYFVDSVEVKKPIDILYSVRDNIFDPLNKSYIEKAVKVDPADSTAKATFIKYEHDFMELDVTASANNFLFIGDTYYPEGWKATIDGKDSEILRANHNFRGIVVPKGNHKVILSFEPQSYFTGKTLSLLINILLTGGLILGIFLNYKEKNKIADKENNIIT